MVNFVIKLEIRFFVSDENDGDLIVREYLETLISYPRLSARLLIKRKMLGTY